LWGKYRIVDLEIGGGLYAPIDGYNDMCDAIAASKGESTKNPPVGMIHDVDFYYLSPSLEVKVWGNSFGPALIVGVNNQETSLDNNSPGKILFGTVPSALIGEIPRAHKHIEKGIRKIRRLF